MLHRGHEPRFYQQASSASTALDRASALQLSLQVCCGFGIHSPKDGSKAIEFPVSVDGGRKEMRDEETIVFYVDDNAK